VFGRKFYIIRDDEKLGNFDVRSDARIFLGYSTINKAYRCYKKMLKKIFESASVKVEEEPHKHSILIKEYEFYESSCGEEGKEEKKGKGDVG
jgi:hypothetical protein